MMTIYFPLKVGRSHSPSASFEDVKQMLMRLMRIELRFLNRLALILVTITTELPLTVCSSVLFLNEWSRSLL